MAGVLDHLRVNQYPELRRQLLWPARDEVRRRGATHCAPIRTRMAHVLAAWMLPQAQLDELSNIGVPTKFRNRLAHWFTCVVGA